MKKNLVAIVALALAASACGSAVSADDNISPPSVGESLSGVPIDPGGAPFVIEVEDIAVRKLDTEEVVRRPPSPPDSATPTTTVKAGDKSMAPPTGPPTPEVPCEAFELDGPTFASNKATLTPNAKAALKQLVDAELGADGIEVEPHGHTDDVPTDRPGGNEQLSLDRAAAVAQFLRTLEVAVRGVEGHANNFPATGPDPDNRSQSERREDDRRVELFVYC